MLNKILADKKFVLIIDIILLIVSIYCYKYIYDTEQIKTVFATESIKFIEENQNPIFKVSKIILYSSAHAVDNTNQGNMQNINISQFTDMAIYIENNERINGLTAENTISELFIDNIKINTNSQIGEHVFNYKNPEEFGKFVDFPNYQEDGIWFKIAHSNNEQSEIGYNNSVFYTDCSNPISIGFINKNLIKNGAIGNMNGKIVFDGSILKNANIDLESISGDISFTIHIRNNLDESFICNVNIENKFEDIENGIYSGYVMKIQNIEDDKYKFLKV